MRLGEFIEGSSITPVLLVLGGNGRMYARVHPEANAVAFVRGHSELKIPLQYEYIEPQIIPELALKGQSTEYTDMRVLQSVYSFEQTNFPVYIGQQLNVFIQSVTHNTADMRP